MSVRQIAAAHGISDTLIRKRVKKEGWERDLSREVRNEVRAKLAKADAVQGATDLAIVQAAAEKAARVIQDHRDLAHKLRGAVETLVEQLIDHSTRRAEIEAAIEEETRDDSSGQRRAAMLKAVSLNTHSSIAGNLTLALKNLVFVERQAYGVDEDIKDQTSSYEERLKKLAGDQHG